jgi:hypothetical protein
MSVIFPHTSAVEVLHQFFGHNIGLGLPGVLARIIIAFPFDQILKEKQMERSESIRSVLPIFSQDLRVRPYKNMRVKLTNHTCRRVPPLFFLANFIPFLNKN